VHVTEEAGEGRLITALSPSQRIPERGTDHRSSIGPAHPLAQQKPQPSRHSRRPQATPAT
jgi:hypothetical protein